MSWIWDKGKSRANIRDHGLRFATAVLVFNDPLVTTRRDLHPGEERWQTVGLHGHVAVFVVHTWPEPDPVTGEAIGRIISAGKATTHARKAYEANDFSPASTDAEGGQRSSGRLAGRADRHTGHADVCDGSGAQRGVFFRSIMQHITLRMDADVIAWFKAHVTGGEGYQTSMNRTLREYVAHHVQHRESWLASAARRS